mmetsp:Transcript_22338/g.34589  ORF Transcript_22338/g.34589 Transcript_22338/m.34589 type:complete len:110 (+) Transcript_22338:1662-1991(+)
MIEEIQESIPPGQDLLDNDKMDSLVNPILFNRGQKADSFYLILSGKVSVCSGKEGFLVELTQFKYMGVECMLNDDYVPDFSAKVMGKTRLLKITKENYRSMMSHIKNMY